MLRTSEIAIGLTLVFASIGSPSARGQDGDEARSPGLSLPQVEMTEAEARDLAPGLAALTDGFDVQEVEWSSDQSEDSESEDPRYTPISLPGGETRTAANPQAISFPSGEGSIEGMGESFSPILSSGTATFTVPIAVAPGRAGVQPTLALSYSSSGGNGAVGFGWNVAAPFISRQTDRGLPAYDDRSTWHAGEDRFIHNGGELVPVSTTAMAIVDQAAAPTGTAATVPEDVVGWQQYRGRIEGGFMRFFRAPDFSRWVVQSPDGTRFDYGRLPAGTHASDLDTSLSLEVDDEGEGRAFRWMLTRSADSHGSAIYYSYTRDAGQVYLSAIHYISPTTSPVDCSAGDVRDRRECTAPLTRYGARVGIVYERREDAFTTYTSGYPVTTALRVRRIEVTAYDDSTAQRSLVRRYHLRYDPTSFHSVLSSLQMEGRPSVLTTPYDYEVGNRSITESSLTDAIVGALLPPMRFGYTRLPEGAGAVTGFGALSNRLRDVEGSPPHSIDEGRAELMDVNSDGLLDLVVTAPSVYPTRDGAPAAGVFFNGFSGPDARVGAPAAFSEAIPVPMRSELAGVMSFTNANIVPMDVDGDGRNDLLHMPRFRSYGWFTPTRRADPPTGAALTSPAEQGWRFSYAEIDLPPGDIDPRIDLGRDGQHIQVIDVNNDHLVDVVRTSGTTMQTWLNLGWLEGGDGRFGSFTRASDGTAELFTRPYESCVLVSGTNVDFESPEVRFADMNGDGLQDIVEVQRGRVRWWPGRGLGSWGVGALECAPGAGARRYLEMADPPSELAVDLQGVDFADVDGDGASDIVQVRFDAIDVWFNRAGRGFTPRHVVRGTPAAPSFSNRVRLVDIDASGTLDAVYADGGNWRYVDLLSTSEGAPSLRPRLLVEVDNGLGALTTMDYDSAAADYLSDLRDAASCGSACESFGWGRVSGEPSQRLDDLSGDPTPSLYRAGGTPVISTIVRRVRISDRFSALGRGDQVGDTSFAYHDGYYEGVEQEFRGFGAADSTVHGTTAATTVHTRTWFHQGRRPQEIADDRLSYNPDEALKGMEYMVEIFDTNYEFLSTAHSSLTTRTLATGLDGRPIQYAFVSETNEIRYDYASYMPAGDALSLPAIVRQHVVAATGAVTSIGSESRTITVRGSNPTRIRTTTDDVDNRGHVRESTAWGHVAIAGTQVATDPQIVRHEIPALYNSDGQWVWRTQRTYITGSEDPDLELRDVTATFDADDGDTQSTVTDVQIPTYSGYSGSLQFGGDPSGEGGAFSLTHTAEDLETTTWHDVWGNVIATCGGDALGASTPTAPPSNCLRFGTVAYDATYQQFATEQASWVDPGSSSPDLVMSVPMETADAMDPGWDRGLGALRRARDPNATANPTTYAESRAYHDGLGRPTAIVLPPVDGCQSDVPSTTIRYFLTSSPSTQPLSRYQTTTHLSTTGCTFGDAVTTAIEHTYVDGLGRTRAELTQGDTTGTWIRRGITRLDAKGQAIRVWQQSFYTGSETALGALVAEPGDSVPSTETEYDAFGRIFVARAEDGAETVTDYHASSIDVCDPLDNDDQSPFFHTCSTTRKDGHGRVIDQIEHQLVPGGSPEIHRLWSWYRGDGALIWLVRALTDDEGVRGADPLTVIDDDDTVERQFIYDSVGRRITSRDVDTDNPADADPRTSSWRYLFNRVGDLVAVRDPRGCGQNFLYDLMGRLVGEQYVACSEAQTSTAETPSTDTAATVPTGSVSLTRISGSVGVDVRYEYDAQPDWVAGAGLTPPTGGGTLGRATGSRDRGQRTALAYDQRGNAIWSARQMALIPERVTLPTGTFSGTYPTPTETAPTTAEVAYDEAHTYTSTTAYDHANRPHQSELPQDPDWGGTSVDGPLVQGILTYNRRGLPATTTVDVGSVGMEMGVNQPIVASVIYDRDGAATDVEYGGTGTGAIVTTEAEYDDRRRPTLTHAWRTPNTGAVDDTLADVSNIFDQTLVWDAASNLTHIVDGRSVTEWPTEHNPQSLEIHHDALYRVIQVLYDYEYGTDDTNEWRSEASASNMVDPMDPQPAPAVGDAPDDRVLDLQYDWDWQGNQVRWDDDADSFYERSVGAIVNGRGLAARPSALYLATNIPDSGGVSWGGAGWVEVAYGAGGNVLSYTVHGACNDTNEMTSSCTSGASITTLASRVTHLSANCTCSDEQHYQYRWDELNRLVEARRFDRTGGSGNWSLAARQRYRYDAGNQRTVSESYVVPNGSHRITLYVAPDDFERRGVVRGTSTYDAPTSGVPAETHYLVGGARVVWDAAAGSMGPLDRNRRITVAVTDILQTTAATVDLLGGELVEAGTYYPSGMRETLWTAADIEPVPLEPMGFTGKEADEEVGATYYGQRWLLSGLGRWASPDPAHVHANGGGEFLNSYHYVNGNLLQARDPIGLTISFEWQGAVQLDTGVGPGDGARRMGHQIAATRAMVEDMQTDLAWMFGIATRSRSQGWRAGGGCEADQQPRVEVEAIMDRGVYQSARQRVVDRLSARYGADSPEYASRLAAWEAARSRLVQALDPRTRSVVHVSDRIATDERGYLPTYQWEYQPSQYGGPEQIRVNPVAMMLQQYSSDAVANTMSPVFLYLHETDHKEGCLGSGNCGITADTPQADLQSREEATVDDIDLVRDALGLPLQGSYPAAGDGATTSESGPGTVEVLANPTDFVDHSYTEREGRGLDP